MMMIDDDNDDAHSTFWIHSLIQTFAFHFTQRMHTQVTIMEDSDGSVHLRNLSQHPVSNEEEALHSLFIGDTNRMIAETPMNMASTRSHCVFTIHVTSHTPGLCKRESVCLCVVCCMCVCVVRVVGRRCVDFFVYFFRLGLCVHLRVHFCFWSCGNHTQHSRYPPTAGSAVIRRSKLHLVDLAGSERIGKTGVVGTLATEAKYINLSLHYLEQVMKSLL